MMFHVNVNQDIDTESPEEYSGFKVVSFGRRHLNYQDPDIVLACRFEDTDGICDQMPTADHEGHKWVPLEGFVCVLSYFEHGLGRWMQASDYGRFVSMYDYGGWDTAKVAGVLLKDDDMWAGEKPTDEHIGMFLEGYNAWWNGEVYVVTITKDVEAVTCPECGSRLNDTTEFVDSLGDVYEVDEFIGEVLGDNVEEGKDYDITYS